MRYETAAAFRAALEARLNRQSREGGMSLARLRKLVVFDRLLARFMVLAPDRWVVKGGVALEYRLGGESRTTIDLDIAWQGGREEIAHYMAALPSLSLEDFFAFTVEALGNAVDDHRAVRYRAVAELDGRRFDGVILDVGLDHPLKKDADTLSGLDLLGFAGIAPHRVPAISLERHLAEKVHAYTRIYEGGRSSTRVKDFVDMVLICSTFAVRAGKFREALDAVFGERTTHEMPDALKAPPATWRVPYRALAVEIGLNPDMQAVHGQLAGFVNPILANTAHGVMSWSPVLWAWSDTSPETDTT